MKSPQKDLFLKLLDLYKWQIDELSTLEKQEMRAKKKNPGYAIVSKARGRSKFTMDDLKLMLESREHKDPLIQSFEQLYQVYKQAIALEMEPRSSMQDPTSPRESESMASISTPKGALDAISRRSFFKEQPGSTTN